MSIKEVRFDHYCKTCQHYNKREDEDPCYECLDQGWNEDSHRPINYKEADKTNTSISRTKQTM